MGNVGTIGLQAVLDLSLFVPATKIFINGVNQMNSAAINAATSISKNFDTVGKAMNSFGMGGMGGILKGMGGALGGLTDIWSMLFPPKSSKEAQNDASIFGNVWERIKTILGGIVTIDIWRYFTTGFDKLWAETTQAVDVFQRLKIQFDSLIARDIAKTAGISTGEALQYASERSQELLKWIRQIAVVSPFTVKGLAKMLAWGKAFGFVTSEAKALTLAIGNFTSAMGLEDENMQRIMYHFGQMKALGKVMGRQLLGLGQDLVPVAELIQSIADDMGLSVQEVRDQMATGVIDPEVFIGKFMDMVNKDFPNAMERMAKTLLGVKQNVQDFIDTLFGMEFLGPVALKITGIMYDFLQNLLSIESIQKFTIAGLALANAFDLIQASLSGTLGPAIKQFIGDIGLGGLDVWSFAKAILYLAYTADELIRGFSSGLVAVGKFIKGLLDEFGVLVELPEHSYGWGSDIILMFAKGMASALSYVLNIIMQLANMLTGWLSSHSPPKILPDLPLWGQNAMQSYLNGWLSADFSIFEDVGSMIERYIRSIPGMGDSDMIRNIIGSRSSLDSLIDQLKSTGSIGSDALDSVAQATGAASQAIKDYIINLVNYEKAQSDLNAVTEYYDNILRDLEAQKAALNKEKDDTGRVREIDKAIATGLLTTQELENLSIEKKGILLDQQIEQVKMEKDTAISAAKAKVEAAKDLYDATKSYLDIQIKNNELLKEQLDILKAIADAAKNAVDDEGLGTPGYIRFPKGLPQADNTLAKLKAKMAEVQGQVAAVFANLETQIGEIFKPIKQQVDELTTSFLKLKNSAVEFATRAKKSFEDFLKSDKFHNLVKDAGELADIFIKGYVVPDELLVFHDTLNKEYEKLKNNLDGIQKLLGINITKEDILKVSLEGLVSILNLEFLPAIAFWSGALSGINALLGHLNYFLIIFKKQWDAINEDIKTKNWPQLLLDFVIYLVTVFVFCFTWLLAFIWGFILGVLDYFRKLWDRLVGNSIIPDMLADITKEFCMWITLTLFSIGRFIANFLALFTDPEKLKEFIAAGLGLVVSLGIGIYNAFFAPTIGLFAVVADYVLGLVSSITNNPDAWIQAGKDLIAGIISGMLASLDDLISRTTGVARDVLQALRDALNSHSPSKETMLIGKSLMQGLEAGILGRLSNTKEVISGAMQDILGVYDSGLSSMIGSYSNTSSGMAGGLGSINNGSTTNIYDQSISMQMSPTYQNSESPIRLRHDMAAAIASMRR